MYNAVQLLSKSSLIQTKSKRALTGEMGGKRSVFVRVTASQFRWAGQGQARQGRAGQRMLKCWSIHEASSTGASGRAEGRLSGGRESLALYARATRRGPQRLFNTVVRRCGRKGCQPSARIASGQMTTNVFPKILQYERRCLNNECAHPSLLGVHSCYKF